MSFKEWLWWKFVKYVLLYGGGSVALIMMATSASGGSS